MAGYRLDVLVFATVCVAVQAFLAWRILRESGRAVSAAAWGILAGAIVAGALVAEWAGNHERDSIRGVLEGYARTYAVETERLGHARLALEGCENDPVYRTLIESQVAWLAANPLVNDIYTVRRNAQGKPVFLVDSETDYDRDGGFEGEREKRTAVGTEFEDADASLERAFAGEASFDLEPWTDEWGTWVSAYCPLHDAEGRVEAVLGVDYEAGTLIRRVALHRAGALLVMGLAVVGHVIGGVATWHRRQRLAERTFVSLHDRLTKLPNRTFLYERLTDALRRMKQNPRSQTAVVFLDVDDFKLINDSLGHDKGDQLLVELARRLRQLESCKPGWTVFPARLGGDEFVVMLEGIVADDDIMLPVRWLQELIATPFRLEGHDVQVTASIGILRCTPGYRDAGELLRDADTAMYRAKLEGKSRAVFFSGEMHRQVMDRMELEQDLRKAVAGGQLKLQLQPIVSLFSGRLAGFEALVRWTHPQRGPVSPAEFIPLAEETGLIQQVGAWVLQEGCRIMAGWQERYPNEAFYVAVNISRRQLNAPGWIESVAQTVQSKGLDPRRLRLEITENAIMRDAQASIRALEQLRSLGIRVLLDDFGTGYSSLASLHDFPICGIKLDRAFIANLPRSRDYTAIISAIISLAYHLNLDMIAEGVEDAQQVVLLQSLGCHHAQGYYFAKPMPVEEAERFLAAGRPSLAQRLASLPGAEGPMRIAAA